MKAKWRDIRTSPKDGTRFLAKMAGPLGNLFHLILYVDQESYYRVVGADGHQMTSSLPVGWMPLPSLHNVNGLGRRTLDADLK
jgi:hypothetical protein